MAGGDLVIVRFHRVSTAAGLLLVPYLVWVTYATALTWAIWRLNPGSELSGFQQRNFRTKIAKRTERTD